MVGWALPLKLSSAFPPPGWGGNLYTLNKWTRLFSKATFVKDKCSLLYFKIFPVKLGKRPKGRGKKRRGEGKI